MTLDKNDKYKKPFDVLIREILDADSCEYPDTVSTFSEEVETMQSSESISSSNDDDSFSISSESDEKIDPLNLQPGQSLIISGGKIQMNDQTHSIPEPQKEKAQVMFYTAEQLSNLKIDNNRRSVSGIKGIIHPQSKLKSKKLTKRCENIDD